MEIEYKWRLDDPNAQETIVQSKLVAPYIQRTRLVSMLARYYDTSDRMLCNMRVSLRMRTENNLSVCCLKMPGEQLEHDGEAKVREEFEVAAHDVEQGLKLLPDAGAPFALCNKLSACKLSIIAETDFTRAAYTLKIPEDQSRDEDTDAFTSELAFDRGFLRRATHESPLSEIELEYKSGGQDAFKSYADKLAKCFTLENEPLSKFVRCLAL